MDGASTYLVLDIETIPDRDLYTPPEPRPGERDPFPPLFACRPVVIGLMWLDETLTCKRIGVISDSKDSPREAGGGDERAAPTEPEGPSPAIETADPAMETAIEAGLAEPTTEGGGEAKNSEGGEARMMTNFADFMGRYKPHIVTWNGRGFDLPVLALRALRYGSSFGWYYRGAGYRYRYTEDGHLDLADVFSDHGAARMTSLDGAARLIGLPGKGDVDGSQVEGLYRGGQLEAVRRYCLADVAQTAFLLLRYKLIAGDLDRNTYTSAATRLLAALETDGRFAPLVAGIDRTRLLLSAG